MNKKYLIFILVIILLISCCVLVRAGEFPSSFSDSGKSESNKDIQTKLKLDFQYSNMRAKTDNKTLYCGFEGEFKPSDSNIELLFENKLTYSKTDNETDTDRQLLNYQINYFLPDYYIFFNMQSLKDSAMGIMSELSHGLGVGSQYKYIRAQIGIFTASQSDCILSRGLIKCVFPVTDQINLILDDTGELNLSDKNLYRITSETALAVELTKNLGLRIGYNIIYIEDGIEETLDTTKRYYTGLSYIF